MHTDDKFWLGFWISAFTTVIVLAIVLSTAGKTSDAIKIAQIRSEHILKSECIRAHGNWVSVDDDRSAPYACKTR